MTIWLLVLVLIIGFALGHFTSSLKREDGLLVFKPGDKENPPEWNLIVKIKAETILKRKHLRFKVNIKA